MSKKSDIGQLKSILNNKNCEIPKLLNRLNKLRWPCRKAVIVYDSTTADSVLNKTYSFYRKKCQFDKTT